MDNYRFIVADVQMRKDIVEALVEKNYNVDVDDKVPVDDVNCFVFWSDGSMNCMLTSYNGDINSMQINEANIEWFLAKI